MHFIATAIPTILLLISLAASGPVKQFLPRAPADKCQPPLTTCSLYMNWHVASSDLLDQAMPLKNMDQPKDLVITDKNCTIVPSSMNQPKAKGPITIYMKRDMPGSLIVNGNDTYGRPLFTYNNKNLGGEDCGWGTGGGDTFFDCFFDC
ncbi:hypothetical protein MFRU_077g00100 [Monilinia fructicola]|nr:hypothetical protein MFRU_077g00100 [Monilinia fructicola]